MAEQPSVPDTLQAKLENRPSAQDAGHGAETAMSPKLQAMAKKLETQQKIDSVCGFCVLYLVLGHVSDSQFTPWFFTTGTGWEGV